MAASDGNASGIAAIFPDARSDVLIDARGAHRKGGLRGRVRIPKSGSAPRCNQVTQDRADRQHDRNLES